MTEGNSEGPIKITVLPPQDADEVRRQLSNKRKKFPPREGKHTHGHGAAIAAIENYEGRGKSK